MRKRTQYKRPPSASQKIPTIIIMSLLLAGILIYGKTISDKAAALFVPDTPTIDSAHANDANDETGGSIVYKANKDAAQSLLPLLSKGLPQ